MKTQLIGTFANEQNCDSVLQNVLKRFEIISRSIFVLKLHPTDELFITYNVEPNPNVTFLNNSILIHRKKESNTIYTINSLNRLIVTLNNGILDKRYSVNWKDYTNSVILTDSDDGYKVLKTTIFKIINV